MFESHCTLQNFAQNVQYLQSNNLAIGKTFVHITNVSTKHVAHTYQELVEINVIMNSFYIMLFITRFLARYAGGRYSLSNQFLISQ